MTKTVYPKDIRGAGRTAPSLFLQYEGPDPVQPDLNGQADLADLY